MLNPVRFFAPPRTAACRSSLSFAISWSLLKLISIELVMASNHLMLCHPFLLLHSIFLIIRIFFNKSVLCIMVAKVLEFQLQHYSFQRIFRGDFLRIDWFDLVAAQRTLKSLLQHHYLKTSILQCSVFFMVQHSHSYMTTGKNIALTIWTFVGKAISLI